LAAEGVEGEEKKQPEFKRVERQAFVLFLVRTKRFQGIMDSLGSRRITRPVSWFLLYLMPVACAIALFLFLSELGVLLSPRGAEIAQNVRGLSILGNLGIPGLNPYIPFVYGWIALVIAMVVHEGAHGVVTKSLGLPVRSSGLVFFLFVPIGAFVEPDEAALKSARAWDHERILGAGVGVNLIVGLVSLLLLLAVVSSMTPVSNGLWVTQTIKNSPAASIGIQPGDIITAVNGVPVNGQQSFQNSSWYKPGNIVNITVLRGTEIRQFPDVKLNATGLLLGVSRGDLQGTVTAYSRPSLTMRSLSSYVCIPDLPPCESVVPFSSQMGRYYTSSLGTALPIVANLLYWIYFLNFNLAIFNALPLYPFDGGQAFQVGVKALAKDRLSEKGLERITAAAAFTILAVVLIVILGPYARLF
jgi:membrane-associated protease RseP (regulator of RpoE activity)